MFSPAHATGSVRKTQGKIYPKKLYLPALCFLFPAVDPTPQDLLLPLFNCGFVLLRLHCAEADLQHALTFPVMILTHVNASEMFFLCLLWKNQCSDSSRRRCCSPKLRLRQTESTKRCEKAGDQDRDGDSKLDMWKRLSRRQTTAEIIISE